LASKAGVLRLDLSTGREKVKIYKDENNLPKGDGVVSYAREESVDSAFEMLNESEIRPGFVVKVEKAEFNQKDE
jgi:HIV Tat-specific factor 1